MVCGAQLWIMIPELSPTVVSSQSFDRLTAAAELDDVLLEGDAALERTTRDG